MYFIIILLGKIFFVGIGIGILELELKFQNSNQNLTPNSASAKNILCDSSTLKNCFGKLETGILKLELEFDTQFSIGMQIICKKHEFCDSSAWQKFFSEQDWISLDQFRPDWISLGHGLDQFRPDWNCTPNSASQCRLSAKSILRDSPTWQNFFFQPSEINIKHLLTCSQYFYSLQG